MADRARVRRLLLIASLAALAAQSATAAVVADPPAPPAGTPEALMRWVGANIESAGWIVADVSSNEALLIQTGLKPVPPGQFVRAYVRWERFPRSTPDNPWRSALQLLEIDCASGRFRELSWAAYAASNFSGPMIDNQPGVDGDWRSAAEGSIMLAALARACPGAVQQRRPEAQGAAGEIAPSR